MTKRSSPAVIIGVGFAVLALALLVHHAVKHGYLVDEKDVQNHEFFIALFGGLGVGLAIGGGALQA